MIQRCIRRGDLLKLRHIGQLKKSRVICKHHAPAKENANPQNNREGVAHGFSLLFLRADFSQKIAAPTGVPLTFQLL